MSQTNEESIAKTAQIQLNELFAMILWEAEKFWTPNNEWNEIEKFDRKLSEI